MAAWIASLEDPIRTICDYIADGGHMTGYARENGLAYTNLRDWVEADAERSRAYARAREDRADKLADEIVEIADELTIEAKHDGEDVRLSVDGNAIQRNRLRVDARKWVAAKLRPQIYGDRTTVEGNPDKPVAFSLAIRFVEPGQR